jgi:hypothetical protein
MTLFPKVAEYLEQQESKRRLAAGKRNSVYDFRGFQIAWPLMVVYGTVVLTSLWMASILLASVMITMAGGSVEGENAENAAGLLINPVVIYGAVLVGGWIGARASRLGIVTILLIALVTPATTMGTDFLFSLISGDKYPEYPQGFAIDRLKAEIVTSLIIVVPGLIGYWRGQRQKFSRYLRYLLDVLPPQDRDTVLELVYGEAQKSAAVVGKVHSSESL